MRRVKSPESSWPGERDPSRLDVELANELPKPDVLSEFKRALLSSQHASGNQSLMHLQLSNESNQKRFTYPVAMLTDFPPLPDQDELLRSHRVFLAHCCDHTFFKSLAGLFPSPNHTAMPLRIAIACLASVYDRKGENEGRDLFTAGMNLWSVILEVDNRESRSLEMLLASVLLIVYGTLTASAAIWKRTNLLSSCSMTIVRRMKLHDPNYFGERSSQRSLYSSLPWCMWLADVLQALHFNAPSFFSRSELWTNMPSSQHDFQRVYHAFLQDEDYGLDKQTPTFVAQSSQEDAILLLIALLSDSIYMRRSLGKIILDVVQVDADWHKHNPYLPLSPQTELNRMQRLLSRALDRWQSEFQNVVSAEAMALYHYCRLYLSCPRIHHLSQLAGYTPSVPHTSLPEFATSRSTVAVSEESISHSWLVLDSTAARAKQSDTLHPAWLPIVVFHASLVIWAKLDSAEGSKSDTYGSTKVLLAFKAELEKMGWPCCVEMIATLDRLMSKPARDTMR